MIAASSEQLFCTHPQSHLGTVPSQGVHHQYLWPDYGSSLCSAALLLAMGRKGFNSQLVVCFSFVLYSTNILLSELSVLPDVIQIHDHHRFCRERAKLHSFVVKESAEVLRVQSLPSFSLLQAQPDCSCFRFDKIPAMEKHSVSIATT